MPHRNASPSISQEWLPTHVLPSSQETIVRPRLPCATNIATLPAGGGPSVSLVGAASTRPSAPASMPCRTPSSPQPTANSTQNVRRMTLLSRTNIGPCRIIRDLLLEECTQAGAVDDWVAVAPNVTG